MSRRSRGIHASAHPGRIPRGGEEAGVVDGGKERKAAGWLAGSALFFFTSHRAEIFPRRNILPEFLYPEYKIAADVLPSYYYMKGALHCLSAPVAAVAGPPSYNI